MTDKSGRPSFAYENAVEIEIGAKLRARRQTLGIAVSEICKKAGIGATTLFCWETGERSPVSLSRYKAWARALGLRFDIAIVPAETRWQRGATYDSGGAGLWLCTGLASEPRPLVSFWNEALGMGLHLPVDSRKLKAMRPVRSGGAA